MRDSVTNFILGLIMLTGMHVPSYGQLRVEIVPLWSMGSNPSELPRFEGADLSRSLPTYRKITSHETCQSVTVSTDVVSETIVPIELDLSVLEESYSTTVKTNTYRSEHQVIVEVTPYRKENGMVYRLEKGVSTVKCKAQSFGSNRGPIRTYNSVLSSGEIFKVAVPESGIYKLTKEDLSALGMNTSNLDPRKIFVYTNYGGMLPEKVSSANPDDLIELPIVIEGEDDGRFDDDDRLIFYAEGPNKWRWDGLEYSYENNIYDSKNYVYLKVGEINGLRVKKLSNELSPDFISKKTWTVQAVADDKNNILGSFASTEGSGKLWFGDKLKGGGTVDLSKKFDLDNLTTNTVKVKGQMAARSSVGTTASLKIGNASKSVSFFNVYLPTILGTIARYSTFNWPDFDVTGSKSVILKYNGDSESEAWIDAIEIHSYKNIVKNSSQVLYLRDPDALFYKNFGFDVSGLAKDNYIWNITNLQNIGAYNKGVNSIHFEVSDVPLDVFAVFSNSDMKKPELIGKLKLQNVHGIDDVDMIVLYPPIFKAAAEKFVKHRSTHSGLNIAMLDVNDVYNEFSSGRQDPSAIRDFAKMLLDRNERFYYLLLMGDGTYDQRGLDNTLEDHRFIPVYETDESLNSINAFPTDDYYGLLSDNEGVGLDGALDIAVGRLTVTTAQEADDVINKIIQYDISPNRFGDWRTRATYTADDEDSNTHLNQMDGIAREGATNYPYINDQKIYIDAYRQESTPGGQRYPDVEMAISQNMDKGHLVFCYLGHGGPKGWAQERILKVADINSWDNFDHQSLIVTATCSFTGYDDPEVKSAGEYALLNPNGGVVALFTTVRAVYASENERLTSEVFRSLYKKENGKPLTFGQIITRAKNANKQDTVGENSRKFALIGDPSQTIALPQHNIVVETVNGMPSATFTDTIGAMEKVEISGSVVDLGGSVLTNFNGELTATVFDKRSEIETLANDSESSRRKIDVLKNIIFKGNATVVNGKFTFSFIVPRDINYAIGYGKLSLYASSSNKEDAAGAYTSLKIGGSNKALADNQAPSIKLFINNRSFTSGDKVSNNPVLLADLSDDLGINVSGNGIGHDLTISLKGPVEANHILNEFYQSLANDFSKGTIRFPLGKLPEGTYELTMKAWDVANKSSEATIEFEVKEGLEVPPFETVFFPNPLMSLGTIRFTHDLINTSVTGTLIVYDAVGREVYKSSMPLSSQDGSSEINIDVSGGNLDLLPTGLYLYKIKLNAPALELNRESKLAKFIKMH